MINIFRFVSLLEGLSFLVILSVTVGFISRDYVFVLGMTHGVLFTLYFILSLVVTHKQTWSVLVWVSTLMAAFIPFAFIPVELFLRREVKGI
jgi:integral membrane protein